MKCAVISCQKDLTTHLSSSNFPRPLIIQNKWKRLCGLAEEESIAKKRVCSDHFHRNEYNKRANNSIQVKNSTVNPSLNLPNDQD